ncbi:Mth938-like domain-containing protein [Frateuria aurantia]
MELILDQPEGYLFIRRYADDSITIVDRPIHRSFILARQQLIEDWPVIHASQLTAELAAPILELAPELVLLGTGPTQIFPPSDVLGGFIDRGIGVEVMSNASAARTHGLLAAEGRNVVAAFILPAGSTADS